MGAEIASGWSVAVLGQVGEGHAVIGQHGVDGVWERRDHAAQELGSVHFASVVAEFDMGEFGHAVDRQEHVELALRQAQLADIDMDVSDRGGSELAPLGGFVRVFGQPGDAVPFEASVQA